MSEIFRVICVSMIFLSFLMMCTICFVFVLGELGGDKNICVWSFYIIDRVVPHVGT